jgi:ubiquinone/menaquinone biosynthesis C-methylase UbiE
MAQTYGAVNLISSLGFSHLWRKRCVASLQMRTGEICADLMCGMGEATTLMLKSSAKPQRIDAVDFCPEMTKRCEKLARQQDNVVIHTKNVFDLPATGIYNRVCCSFGLKTLDDQQLRQLACHVKNLLASQGRAAFVEIYIPKNLFLRTFYLFYIRHVIPAIGKLCLGDPDCYKYLALYTEEFAQRDGFPDYLKDAGLAVSTHSLFFGCARLYTAQKS